MPLIKSGSRQAISTNIREMMAAGHPQKQAIAAAMSTARRYARGGYADGGDPPRSEDRVSASWQSPDDQPLQRYPDSEDVNFARQYGHFDRDPRSEYLNNQRYRLLSGEPNEWMQGRGKLPAKEASGAALGSMPDDLKPVLHDYYARAGLASKRSALAALGFDPSVTAVDVTRDPKNVNILGASGGNEIYANARNAPTLLHESIHRGVERLRGTPYWKPEFEQYNGHTNFRNNEMVPRYLMATRMGDTEGAHNMPQRNAALSHFGGGERLGHFSSDLGSERNKKILEDMEMAASRYMASRNPRGPRAMGGRTGYASGGDIMPWQERASGRALIHAGMIKSPVPGRTDKLPISVGGGAYVLPADHVAALGQNNSMAGGNILDSMFKMGHFGAPRSTKPNMPRFGLRRRMFAEGGAPEQNKPVDIIAAGGEYVVPPEVVAQIGGGDMDKGHAALDKWVKETRRNHIKTLRTLKPPKTS